MKTLFLLLIPFCGYTQITPIVTTVNVGTGLTWTLKAGSTIEGTITAPLIPSIQATQTTQAATVATHEVRIKMIELGALSGAPLPKTITASSYKLTQADNNGTLFVSSTCTVSAPFLTLPFRCHIIRTGSGAVTISGSGITLNSSNSYKRISGRYGDAWINYETTSKAVLTGKLTY